MIVPPFRAFAKIPRLSRDVIITEKLDGTNASVYIDKQGLVLAGCKTRWLSQDDDNFGFFAWVEEHKAELLKLGPGHHFGEWWGNRINRGYGLKTRNFSLFNVTAWRDESARPTCCQVVPVLYEGPFDLATVDACLDRLRTEGSVAAPGFMQPEGVIVYHTAAKQHFKKTLDNDDKPKGLA